MCDTDFVRHETVYKNDVAAICGVAVGGFLFILMMVAIAAVIVRRRRRRTVQKIFDEKADVHDMENSSSTDGDKDPAEIFS